MNSASPFFDSVWSPQNVSDVRSVSPLLDRVSSREELFPPTDLSASCVISSTNPRPPINYKGLCLEHYARNKRSPPSPVFSSVGPDNDKVHTAELFDGSRRHIASSSSKKRSEQLVYEKLYNTLPNEHIDVVMRAKELLRRLGLPVLSPQFVRIDDDVLPLWEARATFNNQLITGTGANQYDALRRLSVTIYYLFKDGIPSSQSYEEVINKLLTRPSGSINKPVPKRVKLDKQRIQRKHEGHDRLSRLSTRFDPSTQDWLMASDFDTSCSRVFDYIFHVRDYLSYREQHGTKPYINATIINFLKGSPLPHYEQLKRMAPTRASAPHLLPTCEAKMRRICLHACLTKVVDHPIHSVLFDTLHLPVSQMYGIGGSGMNILKGAAKGMFGSMRGNLEKQLGKLIAATTASKIAHWFGELRSTMTKWVTENIGSTGITLILVTMGALAGVMVGYGLFALFKSAYNAFCKWKYPGLTINDVDPEVAVALEVSQMAGFTATVKDVESIVNRAGTFTRNFKCISDAIKGFIEIAIDLVDWLSNKILGYPLTKRAKERKTYGEAWAEIIQKLAARDSPDFLNSVPLMQEFANAYRQLLTFARTAPETKDGFRTRVQSLMFTLAPKFQEVLARLATSKTRVAPLWIHLKGPPGTGKTAVTRNIIAMLYRKEHNKDPTPLDVYYRKDSEFWEGYTSQFATVYDDIYQIKDTASRAQTTMELIDAVNTSIYPLNMAHLEQKGATFFESKLIVSTTNDTQLKDLGINSPEALLRRMHLDVDVSRVSDGIEGWRFTVHKFVRMDYARKKESIIRRTKRDLTYNQFIGEVLSAWESAKEGDKSILSDGEKDLAAAIEEMTKATDDSQPDGEPDEDEEAAPAPPPKKEKEPPRKKWREKKLPAREKSQMDGGEHYVSDDDDGYPPSSSSDSDSDDVNPDGSSREQPAPERCKPEEFLSSLRNPAGTGDKDQTKRREFEAEAASLASEPSSFGHEESSEEGPGSPEVPPRTKAQVDEEELERIRRRLRYATKNNILAANYGAWDYMHPGSYRTWLRYELWNIEAVHKAVEDLNQGKVNYDTLVRGLFASRYGHFTRESLEDIVKRCKQMDTPIAKAINGLGPSVDNDVCFFAAAYSAKFPKNVRLRCYIPDTILAPAKAFGLLAQSNSKELPPYSPWYTCASDPSWMVCTTLTFMGFAGFAVAIGCAIATLVQVFMGEPKVPINDGSQSSDAYLSKLEKARAKKVMRTYALPKSTVPHSQSHDQQTEQMMRKISSNIFETTSVLEGKSYNAHLTFLKGGIFITAGHVLGICDGEITCKSLLIRTGKGQVDLDVKAIIASKSYVYFRERDLIVGYTTQIQARDITKYLGDKSLSYMDVPIRISSDNEVRTEISGDFSSRSAIEIMLAGIDKQGKFTSTQSTLESAYRIMMRGTPGDCGLPLVNADSRVKHKLTGFHVAGSVSTSIFSSFLVEDFEKVEVHLNKVLLPRSQLFRTEGMGKPYSTPTCKFQYYSDQHGPCRQVGVLSKAHSTPSVSGLTQTYFVKPLTLDTGEILPPMFPVDTAPAFLRACGPIDPMAVHLSALDNKLVRAAPEEIRDPDVWRGSIPNSWSTHKYEVLSLQESMKPSPEGFLGPNDLTTAVGAPLCHDHLTREQLVANGGHPSLLAEVAHIEKKLDKGKVPAQICLACPKDEKRALAKVKEGKTRYFFIGSFSFLLICRMYFGAIIHLMIKNRSDLDISVGIDPYSCEWKMMKSSLTDINVMVSDHDFRYWDLNFMCAIAYEWVYQLMMRNPTFTMTFAKRVYLLLVAMMQCYVAYGTKVVLFFGMPSGVLLTAILNSIVNSVGHRSIVKRLFPLMGFEKICCTRVFGDDNLFAMISTLMDRMPEIIALRMEMFGWYSTSADKTDNLAPRHISQCSYLKRGFLSVHGEDVAPLSKDSIKAMLSWVDASTEGELIEKMKAVSDTALMEASLHGEAYFECLRHQLNLRWRALKPEYQCLHTWAYVWNRTRAQ